MTRRPAWAEIDVSAVRHNVAAIRGVLAPGCRYMAVVKANAYGHGDVLAARGALDGGAWGLGVILVDEARALRDAGIDAPILLLHEAPPAVLGEVLALDLTPTVFTPGALEALGEAATRAGRTVKAHVKLDTGLNRLGVPPWLLDDFAVALAKQARVEVEGVFSHFAISDPPDDPFISEQISRFERMLGRLASFGIVPAVRHLGSSGTALARPDSHFDMVRVGIATYGIAPGVEPSVELRPALALKAKLAMVKRVPAGEGVSYGLRYRPAKPSTIATIPLGYADGWPRHATGRTFVLVGGRRYPVVGTICMDSLMADLGDDECAVGDEAVLIGSQRGERISANEVAAALGTIAYEVLTGVTRRIERVGV